MGVLIEVLGFINGGLVIFKTRRRLQIFFWIEIDIVLINRNNERESSTLNHYKGELTRYKAHELSFNQKI